MSLLRPILNTYLRWVEKPRMARTTDPESLRRTFEMQARLFFRPPRGTQRSRQMLEAGARRVEALEVVPRNLSGDRVILYVHGGGFVFGSPSTHSAMLGALSARLGARAILPKYRLAPESPFPAACQDVRIVYDGLLATGVPADRIVLGGDSAGGALALGLLAALCSEGAAMPAAAFLLSPLTDLTFSGESFRTNRDSEAILATRNADQMAEMYLAGQDARDPKVSPLFADFHGAPPVWLSVGDTEILRDDARRMAQCLKAFGVQVTLTEEHDLPHVWPIFHNTLPEARATLDALARWIRQVPGWQAES